MKTFEFAVIATGLDYDAPGFDDLFFEAGCDDATISFQKGLIIVEFAREAKTLSHAIDTAIADVEKTGARVLHVEPDQLVSISDIAGRAGLTRAAVSLYANGDRGKGFPAPVARVTTDGPLWNWVEVARWLRRQGRVSVDAVVRSRVIARANDWLRGRDRDVAA